MIVVDASTLTLLFCDPTLDARAGEARRVLHDDPAWAAPEHWQVEVLAALRNLERAGLLPEPASAGLALARLTVAPVPLAGLLPRIWQLGHNLTAYDAAYVAAAEQRGCPLVTADARLARAGVARCEVRVLT